VSYPFGLSADAVAYLAIAGLVLGLLAVVIAALAWSRTARLKKALVILQGEDGRESFVEVVRAKIEQVDALRGDVSAYQQQVTRLRGDLADAIRHVAVVRYDAFGDMGGRMSFSAAMLDDAGDGLVITSINGRTETRTYAKGIKAAGSEATLSPEEEQAIAYARRSASA
jgi:hypothetical protein